MMKTLIIILVTLMVALTGCAGNPAIGTDEDVPAVSGNNHDTAGDDISNGSAGDDISNGSAGDGISNDTAGNGIDNQQEEDNMAALLYQGHGSLRITTSDGKVIYIDPYAGDGYDLPADLILITHQHNDHNKTDLIMTQNPGCVIITEKDALKDGVHQVIDLGFAVVEGVEANNKNHKPEECVGYILTLKGSSGDISVYISGDTSKTEQMAELAGRGLDYALFCADGVYNMDIDEASECAALVGARHSIPYHMAPGELFSRERAELFEAPGRLIVADGEQIDLT